MPPVGRVLAVAALSISWLGAITLAIAALEGCATTPPLPARAAQLNRDGAAALAAGDLSTAEARIALAIEYSPRFTEAWVNLGLIELRRGNLEMARRDLAKARDLNPDLPSPHHALGLLADRRNLGREAEAHYRAALKVDPGFAPSRANLGRRLFQRGAFDEAREQFLRLTEVEPDRLEGWIGLVECYAQLGREEEGDEILARTRERFGDAPDLALLIGRQLLRHDAYAEAEKALTPLTESQDASRRAAAWAWIAIARASARSYDAAIAAAERSLAIDRDDSVATYAMALALLGQGDTPRATEWLTRARALSPRSDAARLLDGR